MSEMQMNAEGLRLYLERVEPAKNVRRFYYAFVGPTICGPICVVRIHGRLGGWQRVLPPLVFSDETTAIRWLERQRQRKLRKGYAIGTGAVETMNKRNRSTQDE
jgi:predicted DNA-binding WGR domain protein